MPGFESSEERKSGTKRTYLDPSHAHAQAKAFLENAAKNPGDTAGRLVALAVMARYADENAVAQSSRSFASLHGGRALPWSDETVELIDAIAAEALPEHLLEPGREGRDTQAKHRQEIREQRKWVDELHDRLVDLDPDGRADVLSEARERLGDYSGEVYRLEQRIRELDTAGATPTETDEGGAA